jgi:hypothetical protein
VAEIQDLLTSEGIGRHIMLDLQAVDLVDRDTVQFLAWCRAAGIRLAHCPGYIREWMLKEGEQPCR